MDNGCLSYEFKRARQHMKAKYKSIGHIGSIDIARIYDSLDEE
jgi:hypothetical protein